MESEKIVIRMIKTARPDLSMFFKIDPATVAEAGKEYPATSNQYGAICAICANGIGLGVRPGEFEFVEAPEWLLKIHKGIKVKPKFTVECQELVRFEIEADTKEDAEKIAGEMIIEKCLNDADSFDWAINAYEKE